MNIGIIRPTFENLKNFKAMNTYDDMVMASL